MEFRDRHRRHGDIRGAKRTLGLAVAVALVAISFGPSPASAGEPPVWKITSVSDPTNFWLPSSQVDRLTVSATSGRYRLDIRFNPFEAVDEPIGKTESEDIPYNATAEEMQLTLEKVAGAGNVTVSGGPGDETGSNPYIVTFTGNLADRGIEIASVANNLEGGTQDHGLKEEVLNVGKPSGELVVSAVNVGGASADGSTGQPITITDALPPGLIAMTIHGHDAYTMTAATQSESAMSCSKPPVLRCTYNGVAPVGDALVVGIKVRTASSSPPGSEVNQATVSGAEASAASVSSHVSFTPAHAGFGVDPNGVFTATSSAQAGAHSDVMAGVTFNTSELNVPAGNVKDAFTYLPPGLVGNTVGIPRCKIATVTLSLGSCPADTIVGTVLVRFTDLIGNFGVAENLFPVFNIEPAPGEPVAFAFNAVQFTVRIDSGVLSSGNYGAVVSTRNVTEAGSVTSADFTFWGVPADHQAPSPASESPLGSGPTFGLGVHGTEELFGGPSPSSTRVPLLRNPTQCSGALTGSFEADQWTAPGVFSEPVAFAAGKMTGCGLLGFSSSMSMLPDTLEAGEPAGYALSLRLHQDEEPDGLATPDVKRVSTTLPMGTVISPSAAWGLAACSDASFGLHSGVPGECPRESQVGTVEVKTPALPLPLQGQVYLASPECDPCTPLDAQDGRMIRLFLQVVGEGESGIVVKLEGRGSINQQTGQITTVFDENPQLPFSELKLTLGGGSRATLANPRVCGPASTSMDLTPWSTPLTPDSTPTSNFEVNRGCFGPRFNPSFVAGMTNIQAGEYGPFTLSFGRQDPDQFLNGVRLQMPPGLVGSLAHVPLCREPQAAEGSCGAESLIGHVQVLTGPGATPFLVTGGQVFLTESYKGAPFGLSIVVPAKAGPYTLSGTTGRGTVVVRSAINVDPTDAHLTVTSDPLPTSLDGIPLQLKVVNVTIDRPGFTFNPTSCAKIGIGGTLSSSEGASATVSSPFQVTNCQALAFKPRFKVSTSGHTSKARGANLDAKVIYPSGGAKQANIARVKVDLPKQLPSRLTTLQKACTAAVFEANPAACPVASRIGIAKVSTPVLPVQLTGPVFFVSHGGEAFPSLIIVLQGYGVRADVVASTFISKAGVTSSTFKTVPDFPFSSFELYLPEGPYSALAANGNLCKSSLAMPTEMVAQNGIVMRQKTRVAVTGCPKAKAAKKKHKQARKARRARRAGRHHGHLAGGGR